MKYRITLTAHVAAELTPATKTDVIAAAKASLKTCFPGSRVDVTDDAGDVIFGATLLSPGRIRIDA